MCQRSVKRRNSIGQNKLKFLTFLIAFDLDHILVVLFAVSLVVLVVVVVDDFFFGGGGGGTRRLF